MSRFQSTKVFEKVLAFCTLLPVQEHRDFINDGARAEEFSNRSSIPKANREQEEWIISQKLRCSRE